jgi:hypothetical protein
LPTLRGRRRSKDITIIKQYKFSYCWRLSGGRKWRKIDL